MVVTRDAGTSYTLVFNPPGIDRSFLHHTGANATFGAEDVPAEALERARLFHFGYPPLLRRMHLDEGRELEKLYRKARDTGVVTCLDMARPDPNAEAGRADWARILERVLSFVDVYLPSFDETLYMLDRTRLDAAEAGGVDANLSAEPGLLHKLSDRLLELGAAVVGFKLGEQGFYLRTTGEARRVEALAACLGIEPQEWTGRELYTPCYRVEVAGTTGAGDCTIAGFLASLLRGLPPEDAVNYAVGAGAFSVQAPDAISGVPEWGALEQRIAKGWEKHPVRIALPGWNRGPAADCWTAPA
jgi:sugar/nucleoside kinase (ribokinase family)